MVNKITSRTMLILVFILTTLCLNSKPYEKYEDMLNDFKNLSIDSSKVYNIKNFTIKRGPTTLFLDSGSIYFCKPINNRNMVAIFQGRGVFKFAPKKLIEINQMQRLLKKDSINSNIKQMTLLFADNTGDTIVQNGEKAVFNPNPKKHPSVMIEDFLNYELNASKDYINSVIAQTALDDKNNETFYAFLKLEDSKDLFFQINPYSFEEIELLRGDWNALYSFNEIINKYHVNKSGETGDINPIDLNKIKINKYTINANIEKNLDFKAHTIMDINIIDSNYRWIRFDLSDQLSINYVKLSDDTPLTYYKPEKGYDLWIKLPKIKNLDIPIQIVLDYQGNILDRFGNKTYMKTSIEWYPTMGEKPQKALFDLTFTTPGNYKFVSVGDLISKEVVNKTDISHWITPYQIRNASFSIGDFRQNELKSNGFQDLEFLYTYSDYYKSVMEDGAYSVEFFSKLFGTIPPKKLVITELPGFHGEAFPGLIHLSDITYNSTNRTGFNESFCAHEVAHQWWGINVDFVSYHDQWLSEGLSEYSALLYVQAILKNNELFFDFLKNYKENLFNVRESYLGKPIPAGPISLGYRNNTTKTKGDYSIVVYQKGAWVFHMLRNLFLDLQTMKEDLFFKTMKEFYQENAGQSVNTKTFQQKVETALNQDMNWFFDQWVNDYKIPKYKFAYNIVKTESGNYKVSCRVEQSDVPSNFQMLVPIKIDFGNKRVYRIRKLITGERLEFDLPIFADKPAEVIFNDLESVLCEVENIKWK